MLENVTTLESNKVISLNSKKTKEPSVKELCQDEDIATLFRLVCQYDLRKQAIAAIEKRLFDIRSMWFPDSNHFFILEGAWIGLFGLCWLPAGSVSVLQSPFRSNGTVTRRNHLQLLTFIKKGLLWVEQLSQLPHPLSLIEKVKSPWGSRWNHLIASRGFLSGVQFKTLKLLLLPLSVSFRQWPSL